MLYGAMTCRRRHSYDSSNGDSYIFLPIVRDDLPGTAGTPDAAKPSIQSDSGAGLGRSLCSRYYGRSEMGASKSRLETLALVFHLQKLSRLSPWNFGRGIIRKYS